MKAVSEVLSSSLSRIPDAGLSLLARLGMAGIFWRSGQTKVDGWSVTDSTIYLFAEEYRLPLLPPEGAAWLAAGAEHLFPVLLVLGLLTRLSALALAAMTLVIQVFVYPGLWPDHLTWLSALLLIAVKGAGPVALDALLPSRFRF